MDEEVEISGVNDRTFPDLSDQNEIENLYIRDNPDLTTIRSLPPSLISINIEDCESLHRIPDLPGNLQSITISNCESLPEIPELPVSLEHIYIENCGSLRRIPIFPDEVTNIIIANCASLEAIPELPSLLRVFDISYCESLRRIPDLPRDLESFSVTNLVSLKAIPDLPSDLKLFTILSCPLAMIQSLPRNLIHFVCDLDQLDELCRNERFLESLMYLLEQDDFVISRPRKNPTDAEKQVFIDKIEEIIRYKQDTESALEIPLQSQGKSNRSNTITDVFTKVGGPVTSFLNPYSNRYNETLVKNEIQRGRSIADRDQGSDQEANSNVRLKGGKSKKQKGSKKSRNKKRKYTKKRRRMAKK